MKTAIHLITRTSQAVIDAAIRTHAQMVLESPTWDTTSINGFLVSGDTETLFLEMTGTPRVDLAAVVGAQAEAQLYAEQRYIFSTRLTIVPAGRDDRRIGIVRPQTIRVVDRRRFLRADLAASSRVALEFDSKGRCIQRKADLLNISVDGLACRLDDRENAPELGARIQLNFRLPGQSRICRLSAHIQNHTPTPDGGLILGLQFEVVPKSADDLATIRQALQQPLSRIEPSELLV